MSSSGTGAQRRKDAFECCGGNYYFLEAIRNENLLGKGFVRQGEAGLLLRLLLDVLHVSAKMINIIKIFPKKGYVRSNVITHEFSHKDTWLSISRLAAAQIPITQNRPQI